MEMADVQAGIAVPPPASLSKSVRSRVWLEQAGPRSRLRKEGALLALAGGVIALSFTIPWLRSRHMFYAPPCIFYSVTHIPCFLCGLTRSLIYTAQGNLSAAFRLHLLGPALFFMTAATGVYLGVSLVSGYRLRYSLAPRTRRVAFWSALGILIAAWAMKLIFLRAYW